MAGGEDQIARVILVEPPHGLNGVRRAQPVGDVHQREPLGHHLLRVDNDGDFPNVARLDFHLGDAGHAAEDRAQVVEGVVAEVGARNVAVQDHHQDGPGAWRDALDGHLGHGRQVPLRLADRGLGQLQRVLHVRVGVEENGNFTGAADGFRAHSPSSEHAPPRLLERPRHGEQHVLGRKIAGVGDNDDARKSELGVDAARQAKHRNQTRHRQQARQQINRAAVGPAKTHHVHG